MTILGHRWQFLKMFYTNICIVNMDSNDKLKEIDVKNRACYSFDHIIKTEDFHLDNILVDQKSYESTLVYNISHKTLIDGKPD